jgi:FkbM family methyltransferase
MSDKKEFKIDILRTLDELPFNQKIVLWGAGETGQEFARTVKGLRPDLEIVCYIDSYRTRSENSIPIRTPSALNELSDCQVIITSVFWSEISKIIDAEYSVKYKIISNALINQSSHLRSYGPFYFDADQSEDIEQRFSQIINFFEDDKDKELLRKLFDLRLYGKEAEFFEYSEALVHQQKKSFKDNDKYSRHIDLDDITNVIEGGIFDGQDTYRLLEILKKNVGFKKIYAFDPFLDSYYSGDFSKKIDEKLCEFHENVLWSKNERIAFSIDKINPANSCVLTGDAISLKDGIAVHDAITIDSFVEKNQINIDLIKLDVEGSEMKVLQGGAKTIKHHHPKMAVSLYHVKEHLVEIPEFLIACNPSYKFSISMSGPTFVDMVLYAS